MTLLELLHWIVATVGLTETLVLMLIGAIWLIYTVWARQAIPPRGVWRWGIWFPLAFCVFHAITGLHQRWQFYGMMIAAQAFNEEQAKLYWDNALWSALKILLLGIVGTAWVFTSANRSVRRRVESSNVSPLDQLSENAGD